MMEVNLIVASGSRKGQEIKITRDIFEIGKSPRCQLSMGGEGVGRHHCAIFRKEGYVAIKPLDAQAPTLINGKKIAKPVKLRNGDLLKVGPLEFELQITVGVSGKKMSKVQSVTEAAARIVEKKQLAKEKASVAGQGADDELDVFAIFGEEAPSEEELPSFITRKNKGEVEEAVQADREEDALAKEKKMQESTRNAAGDAIKAMLKQTQNG